MTNERNIAVAVMMLQRAFAAAGLKPPVALVLEGGQRYPFEAAVYKQIDPVHFVDYPFWERKTVLCGLEIREDRR